MDDVAILTDLTKCIGCEACVWACKEINELPKEDDAKRLNSTTWTVIRRHSGVNIRQQCMHCLDPACVSVCPVAALEKTNKGPVIYHEERCMGCRYCVLACPFEIPKYEWNKTLPRVQKCIMCYTNCVSRGQEPACTSVCPTGATIFGVRDRLINIAKERIQNNPGQYVDHIYGVHEAGGTSVLYISDLPFNKLGFKYALNDATYPKLTWQVLSQIPNVVSVGGILMFGIWWIIRRRITLEEESKSEPTRVDTEEKEASEHFE